VGAIVALLLLNLGMVQKAQLPVTKPMPSVHAESTPDLITDSDVEYQTPSPQAEKR
jgi:hypothetical protein